MSNSTPDQHFDVSNKAVLGIAVPMSLAYISTPLLGIVDTAVIGQLSNAALIGGVAVGAIIFDVLFGGFNFLRAGTTGLTAQALGRSDVKEQQAVFYRAVIIAVLLGLLTVSLKVPFLEIGLYFMQPSAEVEDAVRTYFDIRVLATPFSLVNYVVLGWFLGLGKAGMGLFLQTLLNGLNMVFNATLVLYYDYGVAGIAIGTFAGEAITAILGCMLVQLTISRQLSPDDRPSRKRIFDRAALLRLFSLNRDIMIRSIILLVSFAFFTAQGSRQGDLILAVNAVLLHFFLTGGYFLDGLATAAEQLGGRAIGAGWRQGFEEAVRRSVHLGVGLAVILSAVFILFGSLLVDVMTNEPQVREIARDYLLFAALTPAIGAMAFIMDGTFIGATWSRDMRNMMILSFVLYIAAWWVLMPLYGNTGLWIALWVFLGIRGVTLEWIRRIRTSETFG